MYTRRFHSILTGVFACARVATFTMIKQAVDDQAKQQQDAGARRAAPKL
jgi:hypothetical protein